MRQSTRMCRAAIATSLGVIAALAPASMAARAEAPKASPPPTVGAGSGAALPAVRLRAIVARAWDDSIGTWKRLLQSQAVDVGMVNLQFVRRLAPNNCYGLYSGEGPAYCSGNRTVFVGTKAANRLMTKFGTDGEAAITFLIGHEIGHHIQNINGRFQMLNYVLARMPGARGDLVRRFELEADCYAGVWMHASPHWASSADFRAQTLSVLASIGDDSILAETADGKVASLAAHGTSKQRTRWFLQGAQSGDLEACNTFASAQP